jgi:hypothetical protein
MEHKLQVYVSASHLLNDSEWEERGDSIFLPSNNKAIYISRDWVEAGTTGISSSGQGKQSRNYRPSQLRFGRHPTGTCIARSPRPGFDPDISRSNALLGNQSIIQNFHCNAEGAIDSLASPSIVMRREPLTHLPHLSVMYGHVLSSLSVGQ